MQSYCIARVSQSGGHFADARDSAISQQVDSGDTVEGTYITPAQSAISHTK